MNPQKLQKQLESLKGWREQAFILGFAERAAPNACLFLDSTGFPAQARTLPEILDALWQLILKPTDEESDDERKAELSEQLDALLPEEMASQSYGIRPMRDVFSLLEQILLAMIGEDVGRALDASRLSLATITDFIEFSEGADLSEEALVRLFDQHPLVVRELSFQEELYDLLRCAQRPSADAMADLRELARDEGASNIGVCLDN